LAINNGGKYSQSVLKCQTLPKSEVLGLLGCDTISLGVFVVSRALLDHGALKMKVPQFSKTSGTANPATECNIPEELNPQ